MIRLGIIGTGRIAKRFVYDAWQGLDVGRYGFVKLQYYTPEYGFNDVITYTDSESMFEDLWQEWLDTRLYLFAKGTPMLEMGYEEIFKCLPEEKQKELLEQKAVFAKMAEIELK